MWSYPVLFETHIQPGYMPRPQFAAKKNMLIATRKLSSDTQCSQSQTVQEDRATTPGFRSLRGQIPNASRNIELFPLGKTSLTGSAARGEHEGNDCPQPAILPHGSHRGQQLRRCDVLRVANQLRVNRRRGKYVNVSAFLAPSENLPSVLQEVTSASRRQVVERRAELAKHGTRYLRQRVHASERSELANDVVIPSTGMFTEPCFAERGHGARRGLTNRRWTFNQQLRESSIGFGLIVSQDVLPTAEPDVPAFAGLRVSRCGGPAHELHGIESYRETPTVTDARKNGPEAVENAVFSSGLLWKDQRRQQHLTTLFHKQLRQFDESDHRAISAYFSASQPGESGSNFPYLHPFPSGVRARTGGTVGGEKGLP